MGLFAVGEGNEGTVGRLSLSLSRPSLAGHPPFTVLPLDLKEEEREGMLLVP